jgi:hypothetical protein
VQQCLGGLHVDDQLDFRSLTVPLTLFGRADEVIE